MSIKYISWGKLEVTADDVDEIPKPFKDVKVWSVDGIGSKGNRIWDWTETNTHHRPGVQVADIQELVESGSEVIVISNGVEGVLKIKQETLDYLKEQDIPCVVGKTLEVIKVFNQLECLGVAVGGVFHSTC